jgi:hypothetical protein
MRHWINMSSSSDRDLASLTSGTFSSTAKATWLLAILSLYLVAQQYLRYNRLESMKKKYKYRSLEAMTDMTETEAWEIMNTLAELEFPTMFEKGKLIVSSKMSISEGQTRIAICAVQGKKSC